MSFNELAASALAANIEGLTEKDRVFASSMLKQWNRNGSLSSKQWYWVGVLAKRSIAGPTPMPTNELGKMNGVFELFIKAKGNLKYPKIRLNTESGKPVAVSVSGPRSKYAGMLCVTDGGPYGSNVYYGRIGADGHFTMNPRVPEEAREEVTALLRKFGSDPVGVAAAHGHLTGNCCFCHKGLTDEKSTSVGYGPVCAKKWELPWGKKTA